MKAYIFDQDGTLYPKDSELTYILRTMTKEWISRRLCLTKEEVDRLYNDLPKKYPHPFDGFVSLGLSIKDYHEEVFDKVDPSLYLSRDIKLINLLEILCSPKYVITLASIDYSSKLQRALGIEKLINGCLSLISFSPAHSKLNAYEHIRKKLSLDPKEVCIIGDNLQVDILPALGRGYCTILIGERTESYNGLRVSSIYGIPNLHNKGFLTT